TEEREPGADDEADDQGQRDVGQRLGAGGTVRRRGRLGELYAAGLERRVDLEGVELLGEEALLGEQVGVLCRERRQDHAGRRRHAPLEVVDLDLQRGET